MIIIPIKQTIFASVAFALSHWKKLIEVSIFPLLLVFPFLSLLPELLLNIEQILARNSGLPENYLLYLSLFLYGYSALLVNIYRLVVLGSSAILPLGIVVPSLRIGRFLLLFLFVSIAPFFPVLAQLPFLIFLVYFFLIPMTLNLVALANDTPYKKIKLPGRVQFNICLLKYGVPLALSTILTLDFAVTPVLLYMFLALMIVISYCVEICCALCYRVIVAHNSTQNL
ncbi:MAG: hypothetical protein AAEF23_01465 [Gammaproteobacteria bacterium]|jgi:hypothetical protein